MGLNDLKYARNNASARGALNSDGITGYVMNGIAVSGKIALGDIKVGFTLKDFEDLGITKQYDIDNDVLVWHNLDAHFGRNSRCETYLMLVEQSVTLTQMSDKANAYAKKLLSQNNGKIKLLGLVRNPATGYTVTLLNGMDADSFNAFAKAQELFEDEFNAKRLVHSIFIETRSLATSSSTAQDMRAISGVKARVCTPVIVQDPAWVVTVSGALPGYACVGDVVGLASKAAVSQNIGERTDDFQLQNIAQGRYISCNISSGQDIKLVDLDTLHDKGYCFGQSIVDFDGFWLNDYPTAVELTDAYAYGYLNRASLKAMQLVRKALLPLTSNNRLQTTPAGRLTDEYRGYLESVAVKQIDDNLVRQGDATPDSAWAYIDPTINVRQTNGAFDIEFGFTEVTLGKEITLKFSFTPVNQ